MNREDIIQYCLSLSEVYEDYPFHDYNCTVMRCIGNKKTFALIILKGDIIWVNVKCDPEWIHFWRNAYKSIVPGYHMNKSHWNTVIVDGSVPESDLKRMIIESYELVKPKKKRIKNM